MRYDAVLVAASFLPCPGFSSEAPGALCATVYLGMSSARELLRQSLRRLDELGDGLWPFCDH